MSTNKFTDGVLTRFEFGKFGNYGSQLVVKLDKENMPSLSLENWAYGETAGSITTYEGISSKRLAELGQELIKAASKLEEIERKATT